MYLHHRLNSSRLVVLLQQWARAECVRTGGATQPPAPMPDVPLELSQWLGTVEAVQLSRALHTIESLAVPGEAQPTAPGQGVDVPALQALVHTVRADCTALVTAGVAAPKPARARADNTPVDAPDPQAAADFTAHGPRYLDLQKQIDTRLLALRLQVRHGLAKGSKALRQLAALDAVMEQMLGAREQRLWASLPGHLERRLAHLHAAHQQALEVSGRADEPQRWRLVGGWLWTFEQDLQALLLAEMQVRLQPVMGLLEAARNEKTGQQE